LIVSQRGGRGQQQKKSSSRGDDEGERERGQRDLFSTGQESNVSGLQASDRGVRQSLESRSEERNGRERFFEPEVGTKGLKR